MLTTDGSSFSARSANPSGAGRVAADGEPPGMTSRNPATAMMAERRNPNKSNDTLSDSPQQRRVNAQIKLAPGRFAIKLPVEIPAGLTVERPASHLAASLPEKQPASQILIGVAAAQCRSSHT